MSELAEHMKAKIFQSRLQAIPFRRFMELSLYHPTWGYYCRDRQRFGKQGDFFTNVQVGSLFGHILGNLFLQIISAKSDVDRFAIVEMGAGDGRLMREIISVFHAKQVTDVDFYLVERGRKQPEAVGHMGQWVDLLAEIPRYPFALLFSNELVDAFPVHRLQKHEQIIKEIFVTWNEQTAAFQEVLHHCSTPELTAYAEEISAHMTEGQVSEVNLDAKHWLTEVAQWLNEGYLFTIDYGGSTEDLLFRPDGTMRYFQKHQLLDHGYDKLGEIDITAHVDFTKLKSWGNALGFRSTFYGSQMQFLLNENLTSLITTERQIKAFKQLVHPDGMGEVFRVLVQQKDHSS